MSFLEEAWEKFTEGLENFWESIKGIPEGLAEFNPLGLLGAVAMAGFLFLTHDLMLGVFLENMSSGGQIFWGALTYGIAAVVGYGLFTKMANS